MATSISHVAANLTVSQVSLCIPKSADLVANPALPGKIRGALGTALHDAASAEAQAGVPCPWQPPCGYQVLWRKNGELRPGYTLPAPFVIEADALEDDLWVTVRLFGAAGDYLGEVADALVRGLRAGLSGSGRLEPSRRVMVAQDGVAVPAIRGMAELSFVTPVLIRNTEKGNHVDPLALLRGLVDRVDGLARWSGLRLCESARAEALDAISTLDGDWRQAELVPWRRGALRQGKVLPMGGAVGRVVYRGDLAPVAPLLAIGELCFAGARAAFGQGRYRLERVI